jgi:RNA polymerase sigma-70 factor, ECF subfamily
MKNYFCKHNSKTIVKSVQKAIMKELRGMEAVLINSADSNDDFRQLESCDFDWIMQQHQQRIFRLLLAMVRDSDAAEHLTQECFLRAFKNRSSFRGDAQMSTWLIRIAINLAHDHNRNKRLAFWRSIHRVEHIEFFALHDVRRSPEETLIDGEKIGQIQSAINQLSNKQRTVFVLRFVEEMPLEAISEVMDLEIGTVKSHLFRAVESVKKFCRKKKM